MWKGTLSEIVVILIRMEAMTQEDEDRLSGFATTLARK
jgi:hypothetical protein